MSRWIICIASILLFASCAQNRTSKAPAVTSKPFALPEVPSVLQTPEERAAYVVAHYWDHFNFADTTLISNAKVTEQAFVDYINLFPHASMEVVEKSISGMLDKAIIADCARVKQILGELSDSRVKVVAIYCEDNIELWHKTEYPASWLNGRNTKIQSDNLYDLRAIPTLYLLDRDKRIILKDAPIETILDWLNNAN